jgi:hypothetical protein
MSALASEAVGMETLRSCKALMPSQGKTNSQVCHFSKGTKDARMQLLEAIEAKIPTEADSANEEHQHVLCSRLASYR